MPFLLKVNNENILLTLFSSANPEAKLLVWKCEINLVTVFHRCRQSHFHNNTICIRTDLFWNKETTRVKSPPTKSSFFKCGTMKCLRPEFGRVKREKSNPPSFCATSPLFLHPNPKLAHSVSSLLACFYFPLWSRHKNMWNTLMFRTSVTIETSALTSSKSAVSPTMRPRS